MSKRYARQLHSADDLIAAVEEYGFLPFFQNETPGFSVEELCSPELWFADDVDGPWEWKGPAARSGKCLYGKLFNKKAGFISKEWWPDFCNYRRSKYARPDEDSIEGAIIETLKMNGSMITRELRAACGFNGKGMRSKFDGYLTRLEMATYIVTEDFVYPHDKHNREYGWGWSLLNTPESLYGKDVFSCPRTPDESYKRIYNHLHSILPEATDKQIAKLIGRL